MLSANFKPKQLRHRAVTLRQHGFLVFSSCYFSIFINIYYIYLVSERNVGLSVSALLYQIYFGRNSEKWLKVVYICQSYHKLNTGIHLFWNTLYIQIVTS